MPVLVLWDIDGTLLNDNRVTMTAFNRALQEIYELQEAPARIEYGGKTDSQIVLEVLGLHDIAEAAALDRLERFHERYVDYVRHEFDQLSAGIQVLPGVHEVIDALADAGALQSVLTGNLRLTAELKLRAAGLLDRLNLNVGAFGSDHRNRNELVAIARARAVACCRAIGDMVVVGDTPRDIACGRAGGARTVAVATGNWSVDELRNHQPDAVLPDLSDVAAAVAAILNSTA
jgi:phosphoglycolate phosphatase